MFVKAPAALLFETAYVSDDNWTTPGLLQLLKQRLRRRTALGC
jgi:hypothetical protein